MLILKTAVILIWVKPVEYALNLKLLMIKFHLCYASHFSKELLEECHHEYFMR